MLAYGAVYLIAHMIVRRSASTGEDVVGMRLLDAHAAREKVVHLALFLWSAAHRALASAERLHVHCNSYS